MTMPGNRPKLRHVAAALSAGYHRDGITPAANHKESMQLQREGDELHYYLDTAWRRAGGHQPSRAAHYKRQAKKRANIRARSKK